LCPSKRRENADDIDDDTSRSERIEPAGEDIEEGDELPNFIPGVFMEDPDGAAAVATVVASVVVVASDEVGASSAM
jgi:hypothetical protein